MSTSAVIVLVVIFVAMDSLVVWAVLRAVTEELRSMTAEFPPMPASEPSVRHEFSSMRMGLSKFDNSVHITIDRDYLHIEPAAILRWLGIRAMSVKRTDITIPTGEPRGFLRKGMEIQIRKSRIWFPAWCIEELRK